MKSIPVAGIILCICTSSIMAELISTTLSNGDVLNEGQYTFRRRGVTNSLYLPAGKQLIIHGINRYWVAPSSGNASCFVQKVVSSDVSILIFSGNYPAWNGPIIGPMNLEYGLSEAGDVVSDFPKTAVSFILEIKNDPFQNSSPTSIEASSCVVIPENVASGVDVLLEQSSDMVTWTQCLPGTYNAATQKRFFRVRLWRNDEKSFYLISIVHAYGSCRDSFY